MTDQETLDVTVTIKNTGTRRGQEIVQLYVKDEESSVIRPEKELKGFAKVALEPGEEQSVHFSLDKRSFASYNVSLGDWEAETGDYRILVGKSSRDILLEASVHVVSTLESVPVFHRNSTLGELMANPKTAPILQYLQSMAPQAGPSDAVSSDMMLAAMRYMPLRALLPFTGGAMTEETLSQLLEQFNAAVKLEA